MLYSQAIQIRLSQDQYQRHLIGTRIELAWILSCQHYQKNHSQIKKLSSTFKWLLVTYEFLMILILYLLLCDNSRAPNRCN